MIIDQQQEQLSSFEIEKHEDKSLEDQYKSWREFRIQNKKTKLFLTGFLTFFIIGGLIIALSVHGTNDQENTHTANKRGQKYVYIQQRLKIFSFSVLGKRATVSDDTILTDIDQISEYWGNLRPYADNDPSYFGVTDVGLPYGCQVEQVHVLHRHGARFPSGVDTTNVQNFATKVANVLNAGGKFTGPLDFLNTWSMQMGGELLVPNGAAMEYKSGVDFWNKYGRILYDAPPSQAYYNGTGKPKLFFRSTDFARTIDSLMGWATGFIGPHNTTDYYSILPIPVVGSYNNTLAGFSTCGPFIAPALGLESLSQDLQSALTRISAYAPASTGLTKTDMQIMQLICAYEYTIFSSSDFCKLFTFGEWKDYNNKGNQAFYEACSFGSPRSRAQGLGYTEELIARLTGNYINVSYSTVNATLDSSEQTFPLNRSFYTDMAHEFSILGVLTALSIDYFRVYTGNGFPQSLDQNFHLSQMTPLAARLITEKIGCVSANPTATSEIRTQYRPTQYGYSAAAATNKFIRMRLNSGILPLNTIRGGYCSVGRTDGLCPLNNFVASQKDAQKLANYQYVCFQNYTVNEDNFNNDGAVFP